jgi:ring-1,2-phenylacetyl-CoA epoxidase subunit PaaA
MTEEQLLDRIKSGKLVEGPDYATERYIEGLKRTLVVSGDTELISAPAYMRAARDAPRINSYISVTGIAQDELGHAHIAYRLLRDLGVDVEKLVYERDPKDFRHPYAFDVPLDNWAEMVVANFFYDRAGFAILDDVFQNSSYGPWKRALVKVEREENFHLRHGEQWVSTMSENPEQKEQIQAAIDWMFLMTLEWFGLPDSMKRHTEQIEYGMKGSTNDQLRQTWMSTAVPLCEKHGLDVPAHFDSDKDEYVIDCPFPVEFDEEEKRWLLDEGEISWEQVLQRWKRRGPANEVLVEQVQRGYRQMSKLLESDGAAA